MEVTRNRKREGNNGWQVNRGAGRLVVRVMIVLMRQVGLATPESIGQTHCGSRMVAGGASEGVQIWEAA